ncbi:MAG: AzlD domain-containing protein [Alphaproteobacteria bacterium]
MDPTTTLLTALAIGVAVVAIRTGPLLLLGGRKLPRTIEDGLRFLPAAAMCALTVHMVAVRDGALRFSLDDATVWALLPTAAVAVLTRSTFLTVAAGMGAVAGVRFIAG